MDIMGCFKKYALYIINISVLLLLSGCLTVSFNRATDLPIAHTSLYDLAINDDGDFITYVDIVGEPENMPIYKKKLPLHHRIYLHELFNPATKWLKDYDFNNDKALSKAELTQAWLVRAAELILELEFTADSLMIVPSGDPFKSKKLESLTGLRISGNEEQYIRDLIDDAISDELFQDDEMIISTKLTIQFIDKMNEAKERERQNQRNDSNNNDNDSDTGNQNSNESDSSGGNDFGSSSDDNGGNEPPERQFGPAG